MPPKIYISINDFSKSALDKLALLSKDIVLRRTSDRPSEGELNEIVKEYDVLIIGAKEKMTPKIHSNAKQLKILGSLSVGLDHIDSVFLNDNNITVLNCPFSNVLSVAEHTLCLILALSKKLFKSHQSVLDGTGRKGLNGLPSDIYGKTIGIIGAGKISKKVCEYSKIFGLNILCHTFHPEYHADMVKQGIKFVQIEELLSISDIISIHIPLTTQTKSLIGKKAISSMKKTSIIINTSRMDIVDNNELGKALSTESIAGAAFDVDVEDTNIEYYRTMNNVIMTPHTAGITNESIGRMDEEIVSYISRDITKYSFREA